MSAPIPEMSPELRRAVADAEPVAPRRPRRDWAVLILAAVAAGAAMLAVLGLRRDLGDLPVGWLVAFGAWWVAGVAALLYVAAVPARGEVMVRGRLAGRIGLVFGAVGVALGAAFAIAAPSSTVTPPGLAVFVRHGWPCIVIGMAAAVTPVAVALWLLRGTAPLYTRWLAIGIGAAGGALGGFVLHLHCPIVNPEHLGLIHGGVPLVAAGVAALLAGLLWRR